MKELITQAAMQDYIIRTSSPASNLCRKTRSLDEIAMSIKHTESSVREAEGNREKWSFTNETKAYWQDELNARREKLEKLLTAFKIEMSHLNNIVSQK